MVDKPSLLFCETFSHKHEEDVHLDMIGFTRAVLISEVRVIPQGCKVHPDIRDRLGNTSPSSFKLDMFCKNLSKPSATVFERLGTLDYEEGKSIQLIVNSKTITNVILVRGWYRCLTVSLYGVFANFQPDMNQVPPPPPMEGRQLAGPQMENHITQQQVTTLSVLPSSVVPSIQGGIQQPIFVQGQSLEGVPISATGQGHVPMHMETIMAYDSPGYRRSLSPQEGQDRRDGRGDFADFHHDRWQDELDRRRGNDYRDRFVDDKRNNRRDYYNRRGNGNFQKDIGNRERYIDNRRRREENFNENFQEPPNKKPVISSEELFEPLSGDEGDFFETSQEDTDVGPSTVEKKKKEQICYEDIESDEDLLFDDIDFDERNLQNDFDACDDTWSPVSLSFNPYQCSLSPLENIQSSFESEFELLVKQYKNTVDLKEPAQVKQLQDHIVSDSEAERDAKWVAMLEELPEIVPTAMAYLRSQTSQKIKEKHFVSIISEWAVYALNMDKAQALPLAVNIRFLKAGLHLTTMLAKACDEYQRMLIDMDVQEKLIDLLKTNHMATSLKLYILKALDVTSNTAFGMENIVGWNQEELREGDSVKSIYEDLLLYLTGKPTVRVIAAIKALLLKVHFYESVSVLQHVCSRISKSPVKDIDDVTVKEDSVDDSEKNENTKSIELDISNKDMNDILSSLENIHKILEHGNNIIVQPNSRSFPTTARLQEDCKDNCYPAIFRILTSRRFLESIAILASSPLFCEPLLYGAIRDILFLLLSTYRGLLFLSSDPNSCNGLVRVLLQASDADIDYNFNDLPTLKLCMMNADTADVCSAHHLGLLLVYHLQSLQEVDRLVDTAKPDLELSEMDSTANISILHALYAMTFTPIGRDAVANTFMHADNLKCLLSFLTGNDEFDAKVKKSVSNRYASVLLNITLQHSDDVEVFKKYGAQLLSIPKKAQTDKREALRLLELTQKSSITPSTVSTHDWSFSENDKTNEDIHNLLSPLEKITKLDVVAISYLLEFLKKELSDFKIGSGNLRSVLTTLRLLRHLVKTNESNGDQHKDLQWRLAVIQMFSSNAMEIFISLLHKLGEQLLAPWKQNEPFTNNQCYIMVNVAVLAFEMINTLLTHSLMTSHCCKDIRLVQQLFILHKILCSKPPAGLLAGILTKIQDLIIEILIKFMKGTTKAPESEEAVKASTWYMVFKELLEFTIQKPENFVTGLVLLSELLPTPLPVHLLTDMNEEQAAKVLNNRLFAMANFSCLSSELNTMIKTVIGSCCSMLQYYLRRLTCQLIDLGPSVASHIIRFLCQLIDEGITTANKGVEENKTEDTDLNPAKHKKHFLPVHINNSFALLSYLVCQPGGKIAFLNLISSTAERQSAFPDFISSIIAMKEKETDVSYLDRNLLPLLQSICDHEVCLDDVDGVITLQHLANSLPSVQHVMLIVNTMVEMLNSKDLPLSIIIRVLNILESLTDHDFGVQIIKLCLSDKADCFSVFLNRLLEEVKTKADVPQIYNTISIFIEFINLLNSSGPDAYIKSEVDDNKMESNEQPTDMRTEETAHTNHDQKLNEEETKQKAYRTGPLKRTVFVAANMLREILKLNEKDSSGHPLTELEKTIEEDGKDDEELVSLSQAITTLRMILIAGGGNTRNEDKQGESCQESGVGFDCRKDSVIDLGTSNSLQEQFNQRHISLLMNNLDDESSTANDWFDEPAPDGIDSDTENDSVKVDLLEISEKFLPNLKFTEEIQKGFVDTAERRSKRTKAVIKRGDHIEDTKRLRFDVSALNTPPAFRGVGRGANRGFTRGIFDRGGRFNRGRGFRGGFRGRGRGRGGPDDNFRQRRQNTSRPPSMHVDDFVNMEKGGETMMSHNKEEKAANPPTSTNERFQNNYSSSPSTPNRWGGSPGNFRRPNDNSGPPGQIQRTVGYNNDYNNRTHYGGNRFHNRANSDWNNSQYFSNRGGGVRDNYPRQNRGGGYWAGGGPRKNDDGRIYGGSNYRQGNRGRHQRTFTR